MTGGDDPGRRALPKVERPVPTTTREDNIALPAIWARGA